MPARCRNGRIVPIHNTPQVGGAWLWTCKTPVTQADLDAMTRFPDGMDLKYITMIGGIHAPADYDALVERLAEYGRSHKLKNMIVTIADGKGFPLVKSIEG